MIVTWCERKKNCRPTARVKRTKVEGSRPTRSKEGLNAILGYIEPDILLSHGVQFICSVKAILCDVNSMISVLYYTHKILSVNMS